jgi:molybdate transport system permease protein
MIADWQPFLVSLRLGAWVTCILLLGCFPLAWAVARSKSGWAAWVEALVSLPLVLAPTVLGFYILRAISPSGPIGAALGEAFGLRLAFSFAGVVAGGCLSGLPLMFSALRTGIAGVPASLVEASYSLGKGRIETALRVVLPNMKAGLLAGIVLTFAHAMGEFGIVLMIGGSIPGETKTVSIAVYERVEALDFRGAGAYAAILTAASLAAVLALGALQRAAPRR